MISNPDMEKTILGAMLRPAGLNTGLELEPSDFALDSHRRIFARMRAMVAAGLSVDSSTLLSELRRTNELDLIGGIGYALSLDEGLPARFNPKSYVTILRKNALARRLVGVCELAVTRLEQGADPEDLISEIAGATLNAQMQSTDIRPRPISEFIVPFLDEMKRQRSTHASFCLGIPTGLRTLDRCTTGWRPGELTYVGALPGRGKTSFLLQAMHAAVTSGVGAGCISLEMRGNQLVQRLAVLQSKLHASKLRDARLQDEEESRHAIRSSLALGDLAIDMCDVPGLRPGQIASLARQMYERGARIIFVDFVQIVQEDGRDRREAINRVSASLRDTCKALNIPFVVASQLARRDADQNRRPTLQDLRESGNLEQDAHNVILLYRPKDKTNPSEWTGDDELIIDKQREGATGSIPVTYDDASLIFRERYLGATSS